MIHLAPPSRACGHAGSSVSSLVGELSGFFLGSSPCRPSASSARRRFLLSTSSSTSSHRAFHSTPSRDSSAPSRISYRVAASSSGKGRPFVPAKNAYNFFPDRQDALGVAPDVTDPALRRKRRPDSGEDAFFVSRVGHTPEKQGAVAFAVADGVGGWSESRVDPADFSHALCNYMAESALEWDAPVEQLRAKQLLQAGYDRVVADKTVRAGGSTASVGVGLEDGRVELANLGDSGSVLLRLAAVHHYSAPQTHGFNTPYQLSIIPPRMRAQASIFGGAFLEDFPRDAAVTSLQMQHGDVLMLATDGVYDNLNNQDILKLVTSRMVLTGAWDATPEMGIRPSDQLDQLTGPVGLSSLLPAGAPSPMGDQPYTLQSFLASSIAGEAKLASVDIRRDGPFAKEAQRYYPGDYYRGGKIDDICVIAIVAVDESLTGPKAGGRESRL
ncbi:protein serine/threonine phosphatase 2C [Aspergillus campestris IBT 28561]|uniref:Protein phosphatase n=1 Tax=Aspergillus campestris (strain IBT 28561) TaxID=1392248 RepID=A0A2I1DAW1_ASPC2|nr:protein serine/threonine phosphatase 2C [Aspergillus campestris IBT 28561]PKY07005.1 protein serine/threonine phosphatase 2C [Aspergillus campestris IBT 28561]